MAPFDPRPEDLPSEFAVFPLSGALLLPRGKLPLNIFEPRYLAMVEDSLSNGRMFGMIQPDPQGDLYRVGCLGRVSSFSETDDGRLLITLTGLLRFSIADELEMRRGYRRVRGIFSPYLGDLAAERLPADIGRDKITAALRAYFALRNVDANWEAIRSLPDDALVITLAMACPFEPVEKQALLEAPDDAERAATLLALLEMGAAGPDSPAGRPVS
jgi:Lon protease-like protein